MTSAPFSPQARELLRDPKMRVELYDKLHRQGGGNVQLEIGNFSITSTGAAGLNDPVGSQIR